MAATFKSRQLGRPVSIVGAGMSRFGAFKGKTSRDLFVEAFIEKLMTYALGRGVEPADMSVVRSIVRDAGQNDYRLQAMISGIVESAPFQNRTKLEAEETVGTIAQADTRVN